MYFKWKQANGVVSKDTEGSLKGPPLAKVGSFGALGRIMAAVDLYT